MASSTLMDAAPWATVLAGGEGTCMQPLIRSWLGQDRPKQYCSFLGSRSMLFHTLDRVRELVPREKTMTVIAGDHRRFLLEEAFGGQTLGRLFEQPVNRGTAPGVFLPVTQIMEEDPVIGPLPTEMVFSSNSWQQHACWLPETRGGCHE